MLKQTNRYFLLCVVVLAAFAKPSFASVCDPLPKPVLEYVNPFIGTGGGGFGQGNAFVGATAPFGMMKVGPDTNGKMGRMGFAHTAGYWYADRMVEGFSHTHMHGTGVADYGNILFMPTIGMDEKKTVEKEYGSWFKHDSETAEPGYYAVMLKKHNIYAELTATERAGFHRYTFPETNDAVVLIDPTHALGGGISRGAKIVIDPKTSEVSGYVINAGDFVGKDRPFTVYFYAKFLQPFASFGLWEGKQLKPDETLLEKKEDGIRLGAYLKFSLPSSRQVEVQVGISYVSIEKAKLNRVKEIQQKTFEQIRAGTTKLWEKALQKIEICGGAEKQWRMFYSAIYHSLMMPTLFMDTDGEYAGLDRKTHKAKGFEYYTDFSLWDTYRTLHSLLIFLEPKRQGDMMQSLVQMYKEGGVLPKWPLATYETGTMVGSPANIVMAETYLKGIRNFDVKTAYTAMKEQSVTEGKGREGMPHCVNYNYCPYDLVGGSVSITQELAYADFAIALLAKTLGHKEDFELYLKRSKNYANLWDPQTQFFRPKDSKGAWLDEKQFKPDGALQPHYVEGNAWQYLWLVPYDVSGLVELFGGADALLKKLDEFFEQSPLHPSKKIDIVVSVPDTYYWHGNEPDMHAAYMYTLAGKPDKAPRWIRWVMETKYTDGPDGLAGNDDAGTLSAWYVFSAMGFYPLAGTDVYLIGSPVFEKSVIPVNGKTFTVIAQGASDKNIYVQSATLNGKLLEVPWFRHADIAKGGTLDLKMGPVPSEWGKTKPMREF